MPSSAGSPPPASCPSVPGYRVVAGQDLPGADIRQLPGPLTPASLADLCTALGCTCRSFTWKQLAASGPGSSSSSSSYAPVAGWLKWSDSLSRPSTLAPHRCFYAKSEQEVCPGCETPGYVFYAGMDSPGSELGSELGPRAGGAAASSASAEDTSVQSLAALCDSLPACLAFNTEGVLKAAVSMSASTWHETHSLGGPGTPETAANCSGTYVKVGARE